MAMSVSTSSANTFPAINIVWKKEQTTSRHSRASCRPRERTSTEQRTSAAAGVTSQAESRRPRPGRRTVGEPIRRRRRFSRIPIGEPGSSASAELDVVSSATPLRKRARENAPDRNRIVCAV
jgi:hypothetical protein